MKKLSFSLLFALVISLHLAPYDISAQDCTQLSLPDNAIARFCLQKDGDTIDLAFSPDGKTLASLIRWQRRLVIWDIENKRDVLTIEGVNGQSVRYYPDGKKLVCGSVVYNTTTGNPHSLLFDADGYIDYVVLSPDGKTLAGVGSKGLRFWNSTSEVVSDLPITVLPTDTSVAVAPETNPTLTPIATSSTKVPEVRGLSYSPDGKELAVACRLGVWVYDPKLNTEVALLKFPDQVFSVSYSPDGNSLVAGDYNFIHVYDTATKKLKDKTDSDFWIVSSLIFQDNNILICGYHRGIIYLDISTFEYKWILSEEGIYNNMAYSPDGSKLAVSGHDKTILLYDLTSYSIVSISSESVTDPTLAEELTFDLSITNGKNISGYQVEIDFDPNVLEYIEVIYGEYLSGGIPVQPIVNTNSGSIQLASLSLTGDGSNGDGSLATIKFKVKAVQDSRLGLRDVILSDSEGNKSFAWMNGTDIFKTISVPTEDGNNIPCFTTNRNDVNNDCVVNIQDLVLVATNFGGRDSRADVNSDGRVDIIDLVLVAGAIGETAGAPLVFPNMHGDYDVNSVQQWLVEARKVQINDPEFQRGLLILEQILRTLPPEKTTLLPNYPNPFNPETWIPYQLATPSDVNISIYAADGELVRQLNMGNQAAGNYQNRNRAVYWDGKNQIGESVSSGLYFYSLTAGEFSATRRMLIIK